VKRALQNQRSPRHLQRPLVRAPPSGKSIKMRASDTQASVTSVTTTLASRQKRNSESSSSRLCQQSPALIKPPDAAAASLTSRLATTGLLQRTPSLAQASPFCVVVSSSIDIPTLLNVSHCSNIYHHKRCQDHSFNVANVFIQPGVQAPIRTYPACVIQFPPPQTALRCVSHGHQSPVR
jgi:hypothetical protein